MKWPHEDVSEMRARQEDGLYKFKVVGGEDSPSDGNRPAAIIIRGRGIAPARIKNQNFDLYFRIGVTQEQADGLRISSGEDLDADNEETWTGNPSAQAYKSFLKAAKVADTGDTEEEYEDLKGRVVYVMLKTNKNGFQNYAAFYGEDDDLPEQPAETRKQQDKERKQAADKRHGLSKRKDEEEPDDEQSEEPDDEPEERPARSAKGGKKAASRKHDDDEW